MTLADEDTKSILMLIMQIGQSKAMWQHKLRNLVANFANNASGAIWWPNFQLMQVAPSGGQICNLCSRAMLLPNLVQVTESFSGSVVPLAMFYLSFISDNYGILEV